MNFLRHLRRVGVLVGPIAGPIVGFCLLIPATIAVNAQGGERRVIILGFDGVDPRRVQEYMEAGKLPHLRELATHGSFSALQTTNPAESPVSWSAFSIGANPGKSAIYDFLRRRDDSYLPEIAVSREELAATPPWILRLPFPIAVAFALLPLLLLLLLRAAIERRIGVTLHRRWYWLPPLAMGLVAGIASHVFIQEYIPARMPRTTLARQGTPYWQTAGEHRLCCSILQVPVTFPAVGFPGGRLLTGLGTPDVRGTWGTFAIYGTRFPDKFSNPVNELEDKLETSGFADSASGGKLVHLVRKPGQRNEFRTFLYGPRDFTVTSKALKQHPDTPRELWPTLTIKLNPEQKTATFEVAGASVSTEAGAWTEWLPVTFFRDNPVLKFRGLVRFCVRSVSPEFYAYASPVNFHPAEAPLYIPLSAPASFSREITQRTQKLHETVGWAIATNALKDELLDEDEFLADLRFSFERRKGVIESELERGDWRLLTGVFLATDRVQHMFTRFVDPEHPGYDRDAPERFKQAILHVYEQMDRFVGETMAEYLDGRTDLWIISDHGFASFRKGVHLNSWLVENGFMARRDPLPGRSSSASIDWSQTAAYSLGMGKIYLNRRGREPQGIIATDEEAERTLAKIREGLLAFRDPETGARVVREVYRRDDLYRGPYVEEAAELIVGFEAGYRISWDSTLLKAPPGLIEVNLSKWSGDHCSVDPALVPGFLVTNRKVTVDDPSIIDIARTVLVSLGVPPPEGMEGRDLLE